PCRAPRRGAAGAQLGTLHVRLRPDAGAVPRGRSGLRRQPSAGPGAREEDRREQVMDETLLTRLRGLLGDRFSTGASVRELHSRGESHHAAVLPEAVAFPISTSEVQAVVAACADYRCPMTPFGAG